MGVVFRPLAAACWPLAHTPGLDAARDALPWEIGFLREYGVRRERLAKAAMEARRQGVGALEALLADGCVTDTLFYKCLAHWIDAPFRLDLPDLDARANALDAVRDGRVRLADGTWLLAPRGAMLRRLVGAARTPDLLPRRIAITTPAHLETLALRRAGAPMARRASLALPTLRPKLSARGALDGRVLVFALGVALAALTLLCRAPAILAAVSGTLFLAAIGVRSLVCAAGLPRDQPSSAPPPPDAALPRYTVLVPLYKEAGMVADLVRRLGALDYPSTKLEILLLTEADDAPTLAALASAPKPVWMRTIVVPPGEPRTKPRALNVGLALARGALVTVYDAEDQPEPGQLRAAAARYASAHPRLACLQARLAITRGRGLLPRLFALEYAVLFDLFDVGLVRLGLPLPLGGTSNHFRASALRDVGGWDAWNVTEDADLGLRLARHGYDVGMLDSTTWEEAPARLDVWVKQRRRWTKGWMQVVLVLARDRSFVRDLGPARSAAVALMLVNLVIGPLATPLALAMALWQVWRGGLADAALLAVVVPGFSVASTLCFGWAGRGVRRSRDLAAVVPLLLPYQLLIAMSAWGGLWDLLRRPYHWRKTPHGAEALSRSSRAGPRRRRKVPRPAMPR